MFSSSELARKAREIYGKVRLELFIVPGSQIYPICENAVSSAQEDCNHNDVFHLAQRAGKPLRKLDARVRLITIESLSLFRKKNLEYKMTTYNLNYSSSAYNLAQKVRGLFVKFYEFFLNILFILFFLSLPIIRVHMPKVLPLANSRLRVQLTSHRSAPTLPTYLTFLLRNVTVPIYPLMLDIPRVRSRFTRYDLPSLLGSFV